MAFKTGPTATVQALAAYVDAGLGYPKYGIDETTGLYILPINGQSSATVHGVTLNYAPVIICAANASVAAYYENSTNASLITTWLAANPASGLTDINDLDSTWFSPL